jgi:hypothetical protein
MIHNTNVCFGSRLRWVVSFTLRPVYHRRRSLRCPLSMRLGGPQGIDSPPYLWPSSPSGCLIWNILDYVIVFTHVSVLCTSCVYLVGSFDFSCPHTEWDNIYSSENLQAYLIALNPHMNLRLIWYHWAARWNRTEWLLLLPLGFLGCGLIYDYSA